MVPLSYLRNACVLTRTLGLNSICEKPIFSLATSTSLVSLSSERLNGTTRSVKSSFQI